MDSIKGFRTIAFNVSMTIGMLITVWTGIDTSEQVAQVQDGINSILTGIISVWLIGSVWLRVLTDSPIFKKVNKRW